MARLNYPIGIQDFREIRTKGYHYFDKTAFIHRILTEGKHYFLSRPRRFGKSVLVSTIKEIFSGSRELFEDLWIEKNWDWSKQHPVVHLLFSSINYQKRGLAAALSKEIEAIATGFSILLDNQELKDQFRELLQKLAHTQGRVVLLIDEYDKPIIDYLETPEQAKANREVLKQFYSVLKDADPYLEFVFITGVSKFSKVSIFSDLNNLKDLSINERYNNLLGVTQQELESQFNDRLHEIAALRKTEFDVFLAQVKNWYNGYNWSGTDT
ncbi:AAA family ATPase, partial [Haliscomenobacter sp.]|uniref:ATP-binding protein n=1 Tax=Haliscomenobacter sp. TaxID=2717303 RepID=UPI003364B4DD